MNKKLGRLPLNIYIILECSLKEKEEGILYSCCKIYNVEERMSPFCGISMISIRDQELLIN